MCGQAMGGRGGSSSVGHGHGVCRGIAWGVEMSLEGMPHQTWGSGTAHAEVWHRVLGMSLGAIHMWLWAMVHHAIKGALEHVDGGCVWRSWNTVGWVAHGLAERGRRVCFKDNLWHG